MGEREAGELGVGAQSGADHLTRAVRCLRPSVSEAGVAPETLLRQALDVLNETVPDWRTPMEKQRRMAECLTAIDGFLAAPLRDAADVECDAMRYRFIRTLAPVYYAQLWQRNISGEGPFDDLVDAAALAARGAR